ncbi:MAG: diguanylate cyclase, partial [Ruminococcus sp.]|nr:diguanylate cyclase [Ruminococcus sp.]
DDTDTFLADLAAGEPVSLLIAPAFRANYPDEYERVLGGLKAMGVNHIISVAFGADITTWGYLKYIQENNFTGGISQPCPAVVTYIEKYLPELLPFLFPVQSPLMCAAVYARTQMKIADRFAFLSPCIAKKLEINDPANEGLVHYNVTFNHLMKRFREENLYGEPVTDEIEYGLGTIYPMPGGLKEHLKWFLGDGAFIRQIEGERHMYEYLKAHAKDITYHDNPFLFIDALNCENGCLCGTATDPDLSSTDRALYNLLKIQETVKTDSGETVVSRDLTPSERLELLNKKFEHLDLADYLRSYRDLSATCPVKTPNPEELEHIYLSMGKETAASRSINCRCCGYNSCFDMATAIFNGFNHRDNCVYYLKTTLEKSQHDPMLGIFNRRYALEYLTNMESGGRRFSVVMIDIDGFKSINATYGHEFADGILKTAAKRFKSLQFGETRWLLARYGGDQFMIVIEEMLTEDHPKLQMIREIFDKPFVQDNVKLKMTVCIGVSNHDGSMSVEEQINTAEEAMFAAKMLGLSKTFFYSRELLEREAEEKRICDKIMEALDNDGFFMLYQPKVDVQTLDLVGYEALIRMKESGIGPGKFIPIAEKKGWIWKIGRISTEQVVRQLSAWRASGHKLHPVSINYSSNQLSDEGYVDFLEELLKKYGIEPKYVEIEITEGVLIKQSAQAIRPSAI